MLKPSAYPIARKLTWMNMLVSGVALLLACAAFLSYDVVTFRQAMVRNLSIQAEIIGSNSVSALTFNDPKAAEKTLSALSVSPNILSATVYTADGQPFAGYSRDHSRSMMELPAVAKSEAEAQWFQNGEAAVVDTIIFQGKPSGFVFIRSDLERLYERIDRYLTIIGLVLLGCLFAAFLVSSGFQGAVAEPIVNLSHIAQTVSRDKNYSVRAAETHNDDEVAVLIRAFNDMLAQIQQRDSALQAAHDELESRVRERTGELRLAEENLRTLSGSLLQLQDQERRRIARELHDSTGQMLAALGMTVSTVEAESTGISPKGLKAVEESLRLVEQMSRELRTISHLLHPPLLDELGLESALSWYSEGFSERSNVAVKLHISPDIGRFSSELETAIFRIVQECLTNIYRHSATTTATICLTRTDREVKLEVQDHGRGMPAGNSAKIPVRPGVGLRGMQERVRQLSGRLEIHSGVDGTTVLAIFPVQSASSDAPAPIAAV